MAYLPHIIAQVCCAFYPLRMKFKKNSQIKKWAENNVIARRPVADAAIRILWLCCVIAASKRERIATTSLRTGLAMTWIILYDLLKSRKRRLTILPRLEDLQILRPNAAEIVVFCQPLRNFCCCFWPQVSHDPYSMLL